MGFDPAVAFGGSMAGTHTVGAAGTVHNGGTNGDDYVVLHPAVPDPRRHENRRAAW